MSTALTYLFLLLPVGAIAWIVWSYRRKVGDKEARSRERAASLMGIAQASSAPRPAPAQPAVPSGGATAPVVPATAAAVRRERFLTQPETLAYYLLRTGLPGYEVFPRVNLASVVAVARIIPGRPPDQGRPDSHDLDFVVCDKSMRIVAAVQLEGRPAGPDSARVEQSLATAGIRLVRVNPAALPRREQLGALVLGPG